MVEGRAPPVPARNQNYGILLGINGSNTATFIAGNGGSATNTINITGIGGLGASGNQIGVLVNQNQFNLNGTSSSDSLNFINCVAGPGGGAGNRGVVINNALTLVRGTLTLQNVAGGGNSSSSFNYGVQLSNTLSAPIILATDIYGGPGSGNNYGFYVGSGTLGSNTATNLINIQAGSLGIGSTECGIVVDSSGKILSNNGSTITLNGSGGGSYNSTGSGNYGVYFNTGTITAGNGNSQAVAINITGLGGQGTGGSHNGVYFHGQTVQLNSSNANSSLTVLNCVGGTGNGGNNNAVVIDSPLQLVNGALNFQNCIGGSGGSDYNTGLYISGTTVIAPIILGTDIFGGTGAVETDGFRCISSTVGSLETNHISFTAGNLNTGGSSYGMNIGAGAFFVGDGGTITLNATGGGIYNGTGANNFGMLTGTMTYTLGNGGSQPVTLTITGAGGQGSGGLHHGVYFINGGMQFNLNSTNPASAFNLSNCMGGTGGNNNCGVKITTNSSMVSGIWNFENVSGGGTSTSTTNYGVFIGSATTITAPIITGSAIYGGPGSNNNCGLYVNGGTLGTAATNVMNIQAGSLGTGSNEVGILVDTSGKVQVGEGGTLTLHGTGGGTYSSAGGSNYGIQLNSATLSAGNGSSLTDTINITGIGGQGLSGANHGVYVSGATTLTLNGTGSSNTANFLNCVGGTGGNNNCGVAIVAGLSQASGTLNFQNIIGGGTALSTSNHGLYVNGAVSAPTILGYDINGGPGTGTTASLSAGNIGVYVSGSSLGTSTTTAINVCSQDDRCADRATDIDSVFTYASSAAHDILEFESSIDHAERP